MAGALAGYPSEEVGVQTPPPDLVGLIRLAMTNRNATKDVVQTLFGNGTRISSE